MYIQEGSLPVCEAADLCGGYDYCCCSGPIIKSDPALFPPPPVTAITTPELIRVLGYKELLTNSSGK